MDYFMLDQSDTVELDFQNLIIDESDVDENVELEEASTAVQNIVNGVEGENGLQNTGWIPCDDLYTVEINDVESFCSRS